jgi:hypothetical protein
MERIIEMTTETGTDKSLREAPLRSTFAQSRARPRAQSYLFFLSDNRLEDRQHQQLCRYSGVLCRAESSAKNHACA